MAPDAMFCMSCGARFEAKPAEAAPKTDPASLKVPADPAQSPVENSAPAQPPLENSAPVYSVPEEPAYAYADPGTPDAQRD